MKITSDIYDVDARFARILNKRSSALRASLLAPENDNAK